MSSFGDWFKLQVQTAEEHQNSAAMMRRLKNFNGEDTGKHLNLMQDQYQIQTPGPAPTIEDVDRQEGDAFGEEAYTAPVESLAMAEPARIPNNEAASSLVNSEMLKWVNGLFTELAVQASAFNSSANDTHQVVTVHSPDFAWLELKTNERLSEKKIAGFKAHLVTREWAMPISGTGKKIEIYVVPAAVILDFSLHGICDSRYSPFMTINTADVELKKIWRISDAAMTFDSLPLLAQQLLSDLVRISTGKISEAELFAANNPQPKSEIGKADVQEHSPQPQAQADGETELGTGTPPSTSPGLNTCIKTMRTWTASSQLLQAIDKDMPWLNELKGEIDSGKDHVNSVRLEDLITKLRTVSGQIGALVATYHAPEGSKYNAS